MRFRLTLPHNTILIVCYECILEISSKRHVRVDLLGREKKVNNHHHLLRHLLGDAFCGVWAPEGLFSGEPLDFPRPSTHTRNINLENTDWPSGKRWEDDIFWFFWFLSRFYKLSHKHLQFLENHGETILYHNRHILFITCGHHCVWTLFMS